MTEQQMRTISVEDLFSSGKISRKTYVILIRARLRTAFDLKRYRSGLPRLFRGGVNSIKEINNVLDEMDNADKLPEMTSMLFPPPEPELSRGEKLLEHLGEDQLEYLDLIYRRFLALMAKTRERASTRIANVLTPIPVEHFIRDYLYEDEERILMLSEMSETSLPYLAVLREDLMKAIDDLDNSEVPLSYKVLQFHAEGVLDGDPFLLQYFVNHEERLPVLYLVQKFIIENKSKHTVKAFLSRYDIFDGRVELDATEIKKSPFTITSYSNTIYDAMFVPETPVEVFGDFLGELMLNDQEKSELLLFLQGDCVDEDDERIAHIIEEQHLLLHPTCVVALLGKMLAARFHRLGGYPRSLGAAMENRWRHAFLVEKGLAESLDFERELWFFRDTVVKSSTEHTAYDFDAYMHKRLETIAFIGDVQKVTSIMKKIVVAELQLEIDEEGLVLIPKMKDKALADRLYIILDKQKQPMTLDNLTDVINSGDGRRYVRASVSLALNKDTRFQGSGKKGLYALSVWELPYFGSNADIVYSVLDEANRPMKSDEIVHILTQCPYNSQFSKNDLSSVFSLGKKKFVKLGQGYYGLVGRQYSDKDLEVTKKPFDVERNAMMAFLEENGRVPMLDGDKEEADMRDWFDRKRRQYEGKNTWSKDKKASFALLVEMFDKLVDDKQAEEQQPLPLFPENGNDDAHHDTEQPVGDLETDSQDSLPPCSEQEAQQEETTEQVAENLPHDESQEENADVSEWWEMMSKIWDFVKTYHREPLAMFTAEVQYAEWLNAQKEAMGKNVLPVAQQEELLKLRDFLW